MPLLLMAARRGEKLAEREALAAHGAEIIDVATVQNNIWLPSAMEALVARGITRLLVEGGPSIWRSFADASLVDEVVLYMAGTASDEPAAREALVTRLGPLELALIEKRHVDPDTMWRFRRGTVKGL